MQAQQSVLRRILMISLVSKQVSDYCSPSPSSELSSIHLYAIDPLVSRLFPFNGHFLQKLLKLFKFIGSKCLSPLETPNGIMFPLSSPFAIWSPLQLLLQESALQYMDDQRHSRPLGWSSRPDAQNPHTYTVARFNRQYYRDASSNYRVNSLFLFCVS